MPQRPRTFSPFPANGSAGTSQRTNRPYKQERPSAAKRGYGRAWQTASKAYLRAHPVCAIHGSSCTIEATCVDHVKPHRGDHDFFWDRSNWQAACKSCHDAKTAKEDGGFGRPPQPAS
jgi:5-methylcytosine-specific restriction protein A